MPAQLVRPYRLSLETVAARSGTHPGLVRKLVALGLLNATWDAAGRLWFPSSAPAAVAMIQRLRSGLGLNYAAVGVVLDLLGRIAALQRRET